jgi:hypothetical protein
MSHEQSSIPKNDTEASDMHGTFCQAMRVP